MKKKLRVDRIRDQQHWRESINKESALEGINKRSTEEGINKGST